MPTPALRQRKQQIEQPLQANSQKQPSRLDLTLAPSLPDPLGTFCGISYGNYGEDDLRFLLDVVDCDSYEPVTLDFPRYNTMTGYMGEEQDQEKFTLWLKLTSMRFYASREEEVTQLCPLMQDLFGSSDPEYFLMRI